MGYDTQFTGSVTVEPSLNAQEIAYLRAFAQSRRMNRPAGPYATTDDDYHVVGFDRCNEPPAGQPSLWCDWEPTDDGAAIRWNGTEKFHDAHLWMRYIIDHFLRADGHAKSQPGFDGFTFNHTVNGTIHAEGDDSDDVWDLVVTDNQVSRKETRTVSSDAAAAHHRLNGGTVTGSIDDPRCGTCLEPLRLIAAGAVDHAGGEHGMPCPGDIGALRTEAADLVTLVRQSHDGAEWGPHGSGSMEECVAPVCKQAVYLDKVRQLAVADGPVTDDE